MKIVRLNDSHNLASRICLVWNHQIRANGWANFAEASTEFHWISYNYTQDAPDYVIKYGENLWKVLFDQFGGEDGEQVALRRCPLNVVTRRVELWEK